MSYYQNNVKAPDYVKDSPRLIDLLGSINQRRSERFANQNAALIPAKTQAETGLINTQTEQLPKQTNISFLSALNANLSNLISQARLPYQNLADSSRMLTTQQKEALAANNPGAVDKLGVNALNGALGAGQGVLGAGVYDPSRGAREQIIQSLVPSLQSNLPNAGPTTPQSASQGVAPTQGFPPGAAMSSPAPVPLPLPTSAPAQSTPESTQRIKTLADSRVALNELTPTQQRMLPYATNIEKTLASMEPFKEGAMSMAGKGQKYIEEQTKVFLKGDKAKLDPDFQAYKAFVSLGELNAKSITQALQQSIQPEAQEVVKNLNKPNIWTSNPELAMQQFELGTQLLKRELETSSTPVATLVDKAEQKREQKDASKGATQAVEYSKRYAKDEAKGLVTIDIQQPDGTMRSFSVPKTDRAMVDKLNKLKGG